MKIHLGIIVGVILAVGFSVLAFTEPTLAPPGCTSGTPGCDAPLNVGIAGQSKSGWLRATKLFVGNPPTALEQAEGDGYLRTTGGAILNLSGAPTGLIVQNGNVGIGTASPNAKVTINGGDLYMATAGTGFILKETDGPNCKKFTVNSAGTLNLFTVDCATGAGCLTGYQDTDGDTYTVGNGQSFCGVASLPAGFLSTQSASPDCNDANIALWQNLTGYQDNDVDGFGAGSGQTMCSGSSLPAGYVTNNQDCYDSNSNARPGQTSCFTTHRGDGSFDYDCDGGESKCSVRYSGSCAPSGSSYCTRVNTLSCGQGSGSTPSDTSECVYSGFYGCWIGSSYTSYTESCR